MTRGIDTAELFTPGRLGPYTLPHRALSTLRSLAIVRHHSCWQLATSIQSSASPCVQIGNHSKEEL